MTLHLFLQVIIAAAIVLAFSKKYAKPGLLLIALGFLAAAATSYLFNKDIVLSLFEGFAGLCTLYEYSKATRRRNYSFPQKTKLITGGILTLLGVWYITLGILSPFLVAGVVCLVITSMKR